MTVMDYLYELDAWQAHKKFVALIEDVCRERGVTLTWLSDHWVGVLERAGKTRLFQAYTFPINSASAVGIMRDKVSTYALLNHYNIPAAPHYLLRLPDNRDTSRVIAEAQTIAPLPVVLKPNSGESSGRDVFKATTIKELEEVIKDLATRRQTIALSPFLEISAEYRVILLDDKPKLVFEKKRTGNEWRHNLKHGGKPVLVTDEKLNKTLVSLATKALNTLQGRLAAVDIIDTPDGYKVMEINSGIALSLFSESSPKNYQVAKALYSDIVEVTFASR
jgi:glutathione synthase/RimK-type ligase-like ATP-grasp enzyme